VPIALVLAIALPVPASAATWWNLGVAKATGNSATFDSASPGLDTMARNVNGPDRRVAELRRRPQL
jgi:hypothetical protein